MAPDRRSADPMERIEWQLDQIRQHTLVIGLAAGLVLVGGVMWVLAVLLVSG